jgi:hypothetical protein
MAFKPMKFGERQALLRNSRAGVQNGTDSPLLPVHHKNGDDSSRSSMSFIDGAGDSLYSLYVKSGTEQTTA